MAAAMGPAAPYEDCAILVWEGFIGALYRWQDGGRRLSRLPVLSEPGGRYAALLALADPDFPDAGGYPRTSAARKVMALAAYAPAAGPPRQPRGGSPRVDERWRSPPPTRSTRPAFCDTPLYGCGVHMPTTHRALAELGDRIFDRFREAAERSWLPRGLPLLIAGGCGLNCAVEHQVAHVRPVLRRVRGTVRGRFRLCDRHDHAEFAISARRVAWNGTRTAAPRSRSTSAPASERWPSRPLAEAEPRHQDRRRRRGRRV